MKKKALEQLSEPIKPAPNDRNTFSFQELWETKDIEQKFIIPELLPAHAVAMFIGEDGIGKTQILTQLCLSICLKSKTFLGLNLYTESHKCLIVATEDSKEKFSKAMVKQVLSIKPDLDPKEIHLDFTEGSNFDDLDALFAEIEMLLKEFNYDLIVCDAMSDLFTLIDGDINSNSHARKILSKFQRVVNTYQTTVIIIHHAAKSKIVAKQKEGKLFVEKGDSQGAGAITQKPRTVWALTNDPKSIINEGTEYKNYLHVVKANLMGKHFVTHAIELDFDAKTLTHSACGMVDIQLMENSNPDDRQPLTNDPTKKPMAREISLDQHKSYVYNCFVKSDLLSRSDLVEKLRSSYGVGKNKIEAKDGYLAHLTELGLVVNNAGVYRKGEQSDFTMPISAAGWDAKPEKVVLPGEEELSKFELKNNKQTPSEDDAPF